jgi:hypothetical protein
MLPLISITLIALLVASAPARRRRCRRVRRYTLVQYRITVFA